MSQYDDFDGKSNATSDNGPLSPEDDYAVGYKRPPKHSQFQPGQSGNRKGRPPSPRNLAEAIDKRLKKKIRITENGETREVPAYEALAMKIINDALSSSPQRSNAALQKINQMGVAGHIIHSLETQSKQRQQLDPGLMAVLNITHNNEALDIEGDGEVDEGHGSDLADET